GAEVEKALAELNKIMVDRDFEVLAKSKPDKSTNKMRAALAGFRDLLSTRDFAGARNVLDNLPPDDPQVIAARLELATATSRFASTIANTRKLISTRDFDGAARLIDTLPATNDPVVTALRQELLNARARPDVQLALIQ